MDGEAFNSRMLDFLSRTPGPAAERTLVDALRTGGSALQAGVITALVDRRTPVARGQVARLLPTVGLLARETLRGDPSRLEPVARAGLAESDPDVRLCMVDLLSEPGYPSCAYLLADAVGDPVEQVRQAAARGLRRLVRDHLDDHDVLAQIIPAVTAAMRNYNTHCSQDVLSAVILLGFRCEEVVMKQMDRPANQILGALGDALAQIDPIDAGEFVFSALRYGYLRGVAESFLSRGSWGTFAALSRYVHWLALVPVRKSLERIRHVAAVADDPTGIRELPENCQPRALRLVAACGISGKLKDTVLSVALSGSEALATAALPEILRRREGVTELLLMALHSRHETVQAVAAARIVTDGVDTNLTEHLLGAMPRLTETARALIGPLLATDGFERYWRGYQRLNGDVRIAAGKALLKLDGRVGDLIAGRLMGQDVNDQLRATQMVRQLGMVDRFYQLLSRLARRGDRMVRSAVAAALGETDQFEARTALARCLADRDARVQANAVEALSRNSDDASIVLDKIDSPHNRVRANAIKWLLEAKHPQALSALTSMLTDVRPPHRISALWVVQSLQYIIAMSLVERIGLQDVDPKVRARAATVLRALQALSLQGEST